MDSDHWMARTCLYSGLIFAVLVSGWLLRPAIAAHDLGKGGASLAPAEATGPVREGWVARYNGQGKSDDLAQAVAVDAQGNVYVALSSESKGTYSDYVTFKYGTDGNQLWVARYNGTANGNDYASALTVDTAGNAYVTGYSWGSGTSYDYATVKYDTNGNQLWVARYNGPGSGDDWTSALAVDSMGNVYVTGYSWASGTSYDYATIKYDASGNQLWVAHYNGLGNGDDSATSLAVDSMGNVYVTGYSWASGTSYDYATIKYDASGNQLWVARYTGPGNSDDRANALGVDSAGNVYVTGYSCGAGTSCDYATLKYDANGSQLWVACYNGPGNSDDRARALVADSTGNVYITGYSTGSDARDDYATVKYDNHGNQLWVARYNGPAGNDDRAYAVAVDSAGNVYVTGYSTGTGAQYNWDYTTIKYDTNGSQLWVTHYNGPDWGDDRAAALAVDAAGNVYVTGYDVNLEFYRSGKDSDYATVKYDTNGKRLWVARYKGPRSSRDMATAVKVDARGNVYVTGSSQGEGTYSGYATVKYDAAGNQEWVARYNGPGDSSDSASALAVDAAGNIYVTGSSWGSGTMEDYATVKYDTDGNQLWVARYNGPGNHRDEAKALAVDSGGNVYVTGYSYGGWATSWDYATVKYDANGNRLWVARYNGPRNSDDQAAALAVDAAGNVYVTGYSWGSGTMEDYATVKYDTDGNQLWVARYNGPRNLDDGAAALAVDAAGNVYVTGYSYGIGTWYDYATVKYDTNGNQLWVARYDGPDNDVDHATALGLDSSGNVYVTGYSFHYYSDYATVKYDANGNQLWAARYNGPGWDHDHATALAVDAAGNVYVTGYSPARDDREDYATVKYDINGNQVWVAHYNGPGNSDDRASALAVDAAGNVYVTGYSAGSGNGSDYATVKYVQMDSTPTPTLTPRATATATRTATPTAAYTPTPAPTARPEPTVPAPPGGGTHVSYRAGWNIVAGPAGATFAQANRMLYTSQGSGAYDVLVNSRGVTEGYGYWAYFPTDTTMTISGTGSTSYSTSLGAGQMKMVGNPSGVKSAVVKADKIYTYNPVTGYTMTLGSTTLPVGAGAWVYSASAGTATVATE